MLECYGIRGGLIRAIQSVYLGSRACVRASGKMSGWFPITRGVRQGCVMLPWLFNVYGWNNKRRTCTRVQLITTNMQMLLFTDEIVRGD